MPTYDYVCQKCDHRFEVFQSMSAPRLTDCPIEGCEGSVKRLIGAGAGIMFKGSGFYETDYKRKPSPPSSAEGKSESSSSASSEGKSKSAKSESRDAKITPTKAD